MESLIDLGFFREANPLIVVSRILISLTWLYALAMIWVKRALPHANQALAGALGMVLSNSMTIFNIPIPYDVALFFVAMSQLVLAIVFTRLFRLMSTYDQAALAEASALQNETLRIYLNVLLGMTSLSVFVLFLQYLAD